MLVTFDKNARNKRRVKKEFEEARKDYLRELQTLRNKYEDVLFALAREYASL